MGGSVVDRQQRGGVVDGPGAAPRRIHHEALLRKRTKRPQGERDKQCMRIAYMRCKPKKEQIEERKKTKSVRKDSETGGNRNKGEPEL